MYDLIGALIFGIGLGLSAGLAPGPLTALVISETLRGGLGAGLRIACAPLLTDAPIIVVAVLSLGTLAGVTTLLGFIGMAGGVYLIYLAAETVRIERLDVDEQAPAGDALRRGVVVNLLNPHPYVFWFTVGAPYVIKAAPEGLAGPAGFLVGFYVMLVGSKAALAWIAARYATLLGGRAYGMIMRLLALALAVFGVLLLHGGVAMLGARE